MTFPPIDPYKAAMHAINLGEPEIALPLAILSLVDELRRDHPDVDPFGDPRDDEADEADT